MTVELFGLTFNLYGFILGLAILAAYSASIKYAERLKIEKKTLEPLFWWAVSGGIVGARVYHVIDKWREIYSLDPVSALYIWNGGLGIWGAILGGVVGASIWYHYWGKKSIRFTRLLDVLFLGLPLGQAIGRWGNFFNNEIVGKNGEPLFFYESSLDLLLFGLLMWIIRSKRGPGFVAGVYLIGYGLIRMTLEQLRPDEIIWRLAGFPVAGIFSTLGIILGIYLLRRKETMKLS